MRKIHAIAVAILVTVFAASTSHAIVGIGGHLGIDLSLSMKDVTEPVNIPGAEIISPDHPLFTITREGWKRSVINFGGKAYIDFIPLLPIDAIELSCNFGLWQYNGSLQYLTDPLTGTYSAPIELGVKSQDLNYWVLDGTPYAKLHFDLTVKKQLLSLMLLKFDAGLGMSVHFSTPLLSANLVESAFNTDLSGFTGGNFAPDADFGKKIVEEIISRTLNNAVYGAHIFLGLRAKLPIIPIGIYIDGKFMMPFSHFDKDVEGKSPINGFGLLLNTGISLSF